MPVIKSAQKKLRQDKKRKTVNNIIKTAYKSAIKKLMKPATKSSSKKEMARKATSSIDKAVKKNVMHKNKAARLKSKVSKLSR